MNDDQIRDDELRPLARQLGTAAADRLNVERIAAGVVQRLRAESVARRSRWRIQASWLRAAAAVVLMVGAGLLVRSLTQEPSHPAHYVADDLRDLSADQLREVLTTLDQTLAEPSLVEPPEDDLNDLTTEQLERLLQSLEG